MGNYAGTPIISIRLANNDRAEVEKIMRKEGKTMTEIVREALRAYIKAKQAQT